jgi:hypothetical protein
VVDGEGESAEEEAGEERAAEGVSREAEGHVDFRKEAGLEQI